MAIEGKTPSEALYGEKPKVGHMRVFGCTAYSLIPENERQKLDAETRKCIFLGYPNNKKGYQLHDQSNLKVIYSRDVIFDESTPGVEKESHDKLHSSDDPLIVLVNSSDECMQFHCRHKRRLA